VDHPSPEPPARHSLTRPRRTERARAQRRQPSLARAGRTGAFTLGAQAGVGMWTGGILALALDSQKTATANRRNILREQSIRVIS
jgi:hypothetical protein